MTDARPPQPAPYFSRISVVDQAAEHLRQGIRSGRWRERLPGTIPLAAELGVARNTLAAALTRLVQEGLLAQPGARQAYRISGMNGSDAVDGTPRLRVAVLLMSPLENLVPESQREVLRILALLKSAGHTSDTFTLPAVKTPSARPLAKLVSHAAADAWIVIGGSREVLEWFTASGVPTLASGGMIAGLPIAAVSTSSWPERIREATRRLLGLGHRRIVFISEKTLRLPKPQAATLQFLADLREAGVEPGGYHTPDWDETPEGLITLLDSLFRVTPPTALICQTANITAGVTGFLVKKGLHVPQDVSVISISQRDPHSLWAFPEIDCVCSEEDEQVVLPHLRKWLAKVAKGERDTRQARHPGRLTQGNSVGPAMQPEPGDGAG